MNAKQIQTNYQEVLERIRRAAGSVEAASRITLVAVSKFQPVEAIEELYRLGHRDFGENYAQEMTVKAAELEARGCAGIRWHFIGHLQTNKVKALIPRIGVIHSVDSGKLAHELSKRWLATGRGGMLPVFLEINISGEPSKAGVPVDRAAELAHEVAGLPGLRLEGLMCIPAPGAGSAPFNQLSALEKRCRPATNGQLSMGMTLDFEEAIRAGSTHIRVGTALFGSRPPKA